MGSVTLRAGPGEPVMTTWQAWPARALSQRIADAVAGTSGRSAFIGIDGRSGGGKSTLADLLCDQLAAAQVVRTDDIAWYESMFGWDGLLAENVLLPLREGRTVEYRPPAWTARGRTGAITADATSRYTIVEGCGATRASLSPLLDVRIWVQSDYGEAERRGIARDGATEQAIAFWREWEAHEVPFFAADQPWRRADLIVCGTPPPDLQAGHVLMAPIPAMLCR